MKLLEAGRAAPRYSAKLVIARFFMERMLSEATTHLARIEEVDDADLEAWLDRLVDPVRS